MKTSKQLFNEAQKYIPGGVNSPVRAFGAVGGHPVYMKKAKGPYIFDVDGKRYIDYINAWGPMLFGHANDAVTKAIKTTIADSLAFGTPTARETELAQKITKFMPAMELIRLVNSGTEATMSAIRLARGFTGRDKIIKFEGCYHGHSDSLLVKAGSGSLTFGHPSSPGVPKDLAKLTITLNYNDIENVRTTMERVGEEIACIIVEPIAGNMNLIPATREFLKTLKEEAKKYGALLIFDEIMSGFRVASGGATAIYNIQPDLITLGKVIGGGLPIAAFGGNKKIMQHIAPLGAVYQAGTLSGSPIAVSSGIAMLELIANNKKMYQTLHNNSKKLTEGLVNAAHKYGIQLTANFIGSMFGVFFTDKKVRNFQDSMQTNDKLFKKFFHKMLEYGIYLAPSRFEAGFISTTHNANDLEFTIDAADKAFKNIG